MEGKFSCVTSQERFQMSERKSIKQYIAPRTSLEIGAAKKLSSDTIGNMYGSMKSERIVVSTSGAQPRKKSYISIHYFANSVIENKDYAFYSQTKRLHSRILFRTHPGCYHYQFLQPQIPSLGTIRKKY